MGLCAALSCKLWIDFEGAIYQAMNRSERRKPVFRADDSRRSHVARLAESRL
jgi:hypothetical protein